MNMLYKSALAGIAATGLIAVSASADVFGGGAGGPIPAVGTGGGGSWTSGDGATALPTDPFESSINIGTGVLSVNSITLEGLSHTWIGDLHAVLVDPSGDEHNIFVRPGLFNASGFGNSGDFLGGDYTFVESGAPNDLPTDSTAFDPPAGTYNQTFAGSPSAQWVDGNLGIFNTPLSAIAGDAGDWTLKIYDWAGGDSGSLGGWSIDVELVPAPAGLAVFALFGLAGTRRRRA